MPSFKVLGKIEPPWFKVDFEVEPKIVYRIEEADIDLSCTIVIKQSNIVVTCETNRWDEEVKSWVLQYIFDWVSAEIDLFTFGTGNVLYIHLDRLETPKGENQYLVGMAPELAKLATACSVSQLNGSIRIEMAEFLPIIIGSPTLMLALRDLSSALKYGNNSLTNCGRAIDGLRKALWGKDEIGRTELLQSWERFRITLRLSKPYLEVITAASTAPRHGSSAYVQSATRKAVLEQSWTVMNRFLLYRLRGDHPLSEAEFPIL